MKKSTIAAVAAAAIMGFGVAGTAVAGTEISGFASIQYNALDNATGADDGNFRASGELDIEHTADGVTFRADFDLVNALNTSAGADLPTGTGPGVSGVGGVGVDVEQLNVTLPIGPLSVTAGIFNSPFGLEGQDATDINFAANGLLWNAVPSNMAGALVSMSVEEMADISVGFVNRRGDIAAVGGTPAGTDTGNDFVITASLHPVEGIGFTVGYLTDDQEMYGDQLDINLTVDMIENLTLDAEYLLGDPGAGMGKLDDGFGIGAAYRMNDIGLAIRYENVTFEGTTTFDESETSIALNHYCSDATTVRLDLTTTDSDDPAEGTTEVLTVQLVHSF